MWKASHSRLVLPLLYLRELLRLLFCKPVQWFPLPESVRKYYVPFLTSSFLKKFPPDTVFVATAVTTACQLQECACIPDKKKYYFIQDFENWGGLTADFVFATYRFPMTKIVISEFLAEKCAEVGSSAVIIHNGFDPEVFYVKNPIRSRNSGEVIMLYHKDSRKRCEDSLKALQIVRQSVPGLHVTMFGVPDAPPDLPDWITYYRQPDPVLHNELYNRAAVFLTASEQEGFSLPTGEAMRCGCAVCCTDIPGHRVYVKQEGMVLPSPVRNPEALAENLFRLIRDDGFRWQIAERGNALIQSFTWEKSFRKLEEVLK